VRDFSEIIIIDDFSTDNTVAIAGRFTDKIFRIAWQGYAKQKQSGIDRATQPWVMVLDADERVTDALRDEIAAAISSPEHQGYFIPRKNFFLGKWIRHGGWWPDYTMRLFKRDSAAMELREVHEKIVVNGSTGHLKNPMEHYTYRRLSDYIRKMDTYAALSARELKQKGKSFSFSYLLVKPPFTFLRMFLLQQGFRDGFHGFVLAVLYSFYTFLKYLKLWEMEREQKSGLQ
jgi:glycosyltransferase involved in cell wall biosynthesis